MATMAIQRMDFLGESMQQTAPPIAVHSANDAARSPEREAMLEKQKIDPAHDDNTGKDDHSLDNAIVARPEQTKQNKYTPCRQRIDGAGSGDDGKW
jgi:hypothetical protein